MIYLYFKYCHVCFLCKYCHIQYGKNNKIRRLKLILKTLRKLRMKNKELDSLTYHIPCADSFTSPSKAGIR